MTPSAIAAFGVVIAFTFMLGASDAANASAVLIASRTASYRQAMAFSFLMTAIGGMLAGEAVEAGRRADVASDGVRHVERDYREAMAELLESDDLQAVLAAQGIYSRYLEVADAVRAVADRLWFVVLRERPPESGAEGGGLTAEAGGVVGVELG